ncbi:hypothetical protein Trco_001583 [Trichoderma cornu-damae]|uniref:DUF1868 domain-containing protein n=1 Tax=Trichoderma cornu-damae TaxID=654480 RepID=A0A9P8QZB7_9HYPO|nr:hypothetical protein Trco_001583 [Trichoderma cornu-damae]
MAHSRLQDVGQAAGAIPETVVGPAVQDVELEASQHGNFPRWIGQKFTPGGALLPFPGNTVICHLAQDSPLFQALLGLYDSLKGQSFASLYALLPPTSWHMTVFEGISDKLRRPGMWPAGLPPGAPLEDCTAFVHSRLEEFDLGDDAPFRMRIEGFEPLLDGIALKVVPADGPEERRLRGLRDRISERLLTRHPGHEGYSFHISLSYMLRFLGEEDHRNISSYLEGWRSKLPDTFELGAPEFCVFDDMFAFRRLFYLAKRSRAR